MAAKKEVAAEKAAQAPPEQVVYGNLLLFGSLAGIAILVITFILYVSGALAPHVPLEQLPQLWGTKAHEYVEATKSPTGWGWIYYLGKGDYLNYIGVALLAGLTILGYLVLLPAYLKKKDMAYSILVLVEIIVLVLAASGIVAAGH
ncbi:MAG: DUF1634 domain-containing protein [Bacillota bacterium]|jgi:hypothetical protein